MATKAKILSRKTHRSRYPRVRALSLVRGDCTTATAKEAEQEEKEEKEEEEKRRMRRRRLAHGPRKGSQSVYGP